MTNRNWLVNWLEMYQDREKRITDETIEFVLPKGTNANDFNENWHIIYTLKEKGYNFEITKGDWEYTTAQTIEAKSFNTYSGHKAYLRNRYIVKVNI